MMKGLIAILLIVMMSATAIASPLMYVPTGNSNNLVIIDLETDKIVGRIDELENAHGLAAIPDSEYLIAGSMKPLEPDEKIVIAKPGAVSKDEHVAHHPGGADAAMKEVSYLSIIDTKHGQVVRRIPVRGLIHHVAVSPDGGYAVAVHSGKGRISVVDLKNMEVVQTIQTGKWPYYAVFSRNGERLYISNAQPGTISEINTHTWSIKREIKVGKKPEHMALSVDGEVLFVVNVEEGAVVALDLKKGKLTKRFDVGVKPHGVDVSSDGRWLFVSRKGGDKLSRINLISSDNLSVDLQPTPYHLDYVDSVKKLYVSSRKLPLIWVLDPNTLKTISQINIGRGVAHQMVVLEK